jgi:hypothetical protein
MDHPEPALSSPKADDGYIVGTRLRTDFQEYSKISANFNLFDAYVYILISKWVS